LKQRRTVDAQPYAANIERIYKDGH